MIVSTSGIRIAAFCACTAVFAACASTPTATSTAPAPSTMTPTAGMGTGSLSAPAYRSEFGTMWTFDAPPIEKGEVAKIPACIADGIEIGIRPEADAIGGERAATSPQHAMVRDASGDLVDDVSSSEGPRGEDAQSVSCRRNHERSGVQPTVPSFRRDWRRNRKHSRVPL